MRAAESAERRQLDEARARLEALYAKRGRLDKFRTRAERDRYLRAEIASMQQFRGTQGAALAGLEQELARARQSLEEVNRSIDDTQAKAEDARNQVRELGEQIARLKDEQAEKTERRKELWREDSKLESLVTHAADELRGAERTLASMMDKVRALVSMRPPELMERIVGYWQWSPFHRPNRSPDAGFRWCLWASVPSLRDHGRQVQHRCRAYRW